MNIFELTGESRKDVGKGASRRLRHEDAVPAIIYGGKEPAHNITLAQKSVRKALQHEAFYSHILTLHIDGKAQSVVLKDLQRHPYKPIIMHMDFQRISANEKLHMRVPIHFLNEEKAPGVKAGGIVSHSMKDIEVSCLPADLPEFIAVDMANVELDGSVHLSEITAPKGVEFVIHGEDHTVAAIHLPRVVVEEEPVSTEATAEGEAGETPAETQEPKAEE